MGCFIGEYVSNILKFGQLRQKSEQKKLYDIIQIFLFTSVILECLLVILVKESPIFKVGIVCVVVFYSLSGFESKKNLRQLKKLTL